MIWIVIVSGVVVLLAWVIIIWKLNGAIKVNIKEMYDNDLKELRRQGIIK